MGSYYDLENDVWETASDQDCLKLAASAIKKGNVIALPTDTVFGLACTPFLATAVDSIFAIKDRPKGVPLPVLVPNFQVGVRDMELTNDEEMRTLGVLADRFWPGPLTVAAESSSSALSFVGLDNKIGLRSPGESFASQLCMEVIFACTSANLHGLPPALSAKDVVEAFSLTDHAVRAKMIQSGLIFVFDGSVSHHLSSTVIELSGKLWKMQRQGPISQIEIESALRGDS